ncbi:GNAT family N-acetyltransferase [Deinococcus pimensis]|uniref:GNAT family N-acetyltransferase n=1 Tax=Deinococcus pimensis TaxID=309888 RepID=UPI0006947BC0|nr:GNAT family N-acetyltransferase [Deinococcus pimensis]
MHLDSPSTRRARPSHERRPPRLWVTRVDDVTRQAVLTLTVAEGQAGFVVAPRDDLTDIEADPCSEAHAVLHDGEVVGFYHLDFHPLGIAERAFPQPSCGLRSFLIDTRHQGRGYGRAAMHALIQDLRARRPDVQRLNLTVNCRNVHARALYLAVGFTDAGPLFHGGPNGPQHVMSFDLTRAPEKRVNR